MNNDAKVRELMKGAIDMHVHVGPDLSARTNDFINIVVEAREFGLAGLLLKDWQFPTMDRAYVMNRLFPDFKVFSSLTLNYSVGGINPEAVRCAIELGIKEVFMPVLTPHVIAAYGELLRERVPEGARGLSILSDKGEFLPEIDQVLHLVAEAGDVILGTGHISTEEIMLLVKRAREVGVENVLVTHAYFPGEVELPVEKQIQLAEMGAYIEHVYSACKWPPENPTPPEFLADQIRAVGPDYCILSTDAGGVHAPPPPVVFRECVTEMLRCGFDEAEIKSMINDNPRQLLGLQ